MIHIVGPGGAGQTYFTQFLMENNIDTSRPHNMDGLKHLPMPPDYEKLYTKSKKYKYNEIDKCIFIFNDSGKSILSHYRRGWAWEQLKRLGDPYKIGQGKHSLNIVKNRSPNEDREKFFQYTIDNNKDLYGIEIQFNNWLQHSKLPTLFINFKDILKYKDTISKFIGKNIDFNKFEYQIRHKKTKKVIQEAENDTESIIYKFLQIYKNLDDTFNKYSGTIINL
tara:strand:+ start:1910 stop:2578 length:669 start_codon:yes stop_codon:yes gene_type:complete